MQFSKLKNKLSWPIRFLKYRSLSGIKSKKDFYKVIEQERERANRNNHQVSLILFDLESFPDNSKERKQLVKNIMKRKRNIDEIGWYNKNSVGVILPYTSSTGARRFSVRLSRTLNFIMPDSFCYLFTYPLEGQADEGIANSDHKAAGSIVDVIKSAPDDNVITDADDDETNLDKYTQKKSIRSVGQ